MTLACFWFRSVSAHSLFTFQRNLCLQEGESLGRPKARPYRKEVVVMLPEFFSSLSCVPTPWRPLSPASQVARAFKESMSLPITAIWGSLLLLASTPLNLLLRFTASTSLGGQDGTTPRTTEEGWGLCTNPKH